MSHSMIRIGALATCGLSLAATAATIEVDDGAVAVAEDGACSLAEAIANANTDARTFDSIGECGPGSSDDQVNLPKRGSFGFLMDPLVVSSVVTISGDGSTISDQYGPIIHVVDGGNLTFTNLTLQGAPGALGTAILNDAGGTLIVDAATVAQQRTAFTNRGLMTISNSQIIDNYGYEVAGIFNDGGELTITSSLISGNAIIFSGGTGGLKNTTEGIVTVSGSTFSNNRTGSQVGSGGAVSNSGQMTVRQSTFYSNTARTNGGAIFNEGSLSMVNSTLSGNQAISNGGAIFNYGDLEVINNTLARNTASFGAGGIANEATVSIVNTLVVANVNHQDPSTADCASPVDFTANVKNWIEDGSCGAEFSGDLPLRPLADNGGGTSTIALPAFSEAVGVGDNDACPPTDQRGVLRNDGQCDIGAFEFQDLIVQLGFELPPEDPETR